MRVPTDIVVEISSGGFDTIDVVAVVVNLFVTVIIIADTAVIGPVRVFGSPAGAIALPSSPPLLLPMVFKSQEFPEVVRTMILRFIVCRGGMASRLGEIGDSPGSTGE